MGSLLYAAFFLSGASGLIYQVTWVRQFGNVFGNTIHSAALVVAVFMLGLGAGAYAAGRWADRRVDDDPRALLRAYVLAEVLLAALGVGLSLLLPHLAASVARWSQYTIGLDGWHELSAISYGVRAATAVVLLAPITLVMGATLTLLIRHLVRFDLAAGHVRIARLYGANTVGAAAGALLTDFVLVRVAGLQGAQFTAAGLNLVAAALAVAVSTFAAAPPLRRTPAPHVPERGS